MKAPCQSTFGLAFIDRISTHACQRVSCEGQERPLTLKNITLMGNMSARDERFVIYVGCLSCTQCAWCREEKHARKHHRGCALLSLSSLFYMFDLEARHTRMWAPILNCGFQKHFFLTLYSRREMAFALMTNMPKCSTRGSERCVEFNNNKSKLIHEGVAVVALTLPTLLQYFDNSVIMAANVFLLK